MQKQLIRGLLAICAGAGAAAVGQQARAASPYVVDGVTLAHSLWLPRQYQCSPSEQFAQYTFCRLSRHEDGKRSAFTATTSVLRDQSRTVAYVNRDIMPAFFAGDDMEAEVKRLSSRLGAPAQEIRLPEREGARKGVIVLWGKLQVEQLTKQTESTDESQSSEQTLLLVDHLGDVQQSRKLGLPVYRLAGGAGFLWSASAQDGRGHLRFLAADPGVLAGVKDPGASAPARKKEIAEPAPKVRTNVARAAKDGTEPTLSGKESTGSIGTKDLRPFLALQPSPVLSGGAANPELSYPKENLRVSIAQKTRPDAERARIMDAERLAAEEREKARFAWARFEAERATDARIRLTWTVVAAFFMLSAILALLQVLRRGEEQLILAEAGVQRVTADTARVPGWLGRAGAKVAAALTKLRASFGPSVTLAGLQG